MLDGNRRAVHLAALPGLATGVLAQDEAEGHRPRRIPSYHSIWGRFGTCDAAVDAALTLDDEDEEDELADEGAPIAQGEASEGGGDELADVGDELANGRDALEKVGGLHDAS